MLKKFLLILAAALCTVSLRGIEIDEVDYQALKGALANAASSLKNANIGSAPAAVLPMPGDGNGKITGLLKNMLTNAGITVVAGKDDPMWDRLLKEYEWNERKNDILDPATLLKFGKLKGVRILIYGRISAIVRDEKKVFVEVELHGTDLQTAQHIWGGNFAFRQYKGGDIEGIINLDYGLRELLKKNFASAAASITAPAAAAKLQKIKTVTVIPVSGDIDQYVTGLAVEMLTGTRHIPRNPRIPSLSQARLFAKSNQLGTDGIFYGAVRDLSRKQLKAESRYDKDAYEISADMQLFIEDSNGNILWSKTITLQEKMMVAKELSDKEKVMSFFEKNLKIILIVIGGIFGVILLFFLAAYLRAAGNVR